MVKQIDKNTLRIDLGRDSYNLNFGNNLIQRLASDLRQQDRKKFIVFTDKNLVEHGYVEQMEDALRSSDSKVDTIVIEPGEKSKTFDNYTNLAKAIDELGHERSSVMIALGGGVVGDLAGYLAATYMRGIPFVQFPTTTLSQADSSIGGKVGVDTHMGKNRWGAFKQPNAVYLDLATLSTLTEEHYFSGIAEWVKHAVIYDNDYFNFLEQNVEALKDQDHDVLKKCAMWNAKIKGEVVEIDQFENGRRKILNCGHTLGHSIEHLVNEKGLYNNGEIYPHGFAIAIGSMIAGYISAHLDSTDFTMNDLARQAGLLHRLESPIVLPYGLNPDEIIGHTITDKKVENGKVAYVLPDALGKMHKVSDNEFGGNYAMKVGVDIPVKLIEKAVKELEF